MLSMPNKHIYFIGIGGGSLNGLAQVLLARGYRVSGSDAQESEVTKNLQKLGIEVFIGQRAANITKNIDEVIISSAVSNGPGLVEVQQAEKLGIPVAKRTVWWSRLMTEARWAVAVAGSHGKTTTTAMLGHILAVAGLDPTVLVGGFVPDFNGTVRAGSKEIIVVEADEYDRAFYATRPNISIITNVDYDHPDTYPTPASYVQAFRRFARLSAKRHGKLIVYGDDAATRQALKNIQNVVWYGHKNRPAGISSNIPGEHMLMNAQAAAKAAHEIGVKWPVITKALKSFKGVGRRFNYLGEYKGMKIYDDFAHHHKEIEVVLKTARAKAKKSLAVIFQPHQRIRTKQFAKQFAKALSLADEVRLLPIYTVLGREEDIKVDSNVIAEHDSKIKLVQPNKLEGVLDELSAKCDVLMCLGAGNIINLIKPLIK